MQQDGCQVNRGSLVSDLFGKLSELTSEVMNTQTRGAQDREDLLKPQVLVINRSRPPATRFSCTKILPCLTMRNIKRTCSPFRVVHGPREPEVFLWSAFDLSCE